MIRNLVTPITTTRYWSGIFESPAFYQEYNSLFGSRRSYNNNSEVFFHTGVDFAGGVSLPIIAPAAGKVVFAGHLTVRGNTVFIDHGWGIYSGFFHQSKLDVKFGDVVTLGQKIGEVGNSGRVNGKDDFPGAGAHLHWELWVNGIQVNPLHWLNEEYP
jgi:murein DD-endopeptidase MepM/ murein hydrolase activator NlpD